MRSTIKFVGIYVGISVFLVLMQAIVFYPDTPSTPSAWVWAFLLAVPLQLAFEFLGELVSNNKATRFVEEKTATQSFSLLRILYGVVLFSVATGLVIAAGYAWQVLKP